MASGVSSPNDVVPSVQVLNEDLEHLKKNMDIFFLTVMGSIVFFLQTGFAFYESGSVRTKNVTNVLFLNYLDTSIGSLVYLLCGYALAFGEGNGFCGTQYFALVDLPYDKMAHCFFQYTFSATAVAVVKSALHERSSMTAYFTCIIVISGVTYPIVSHWAWSQFGWLCNMGYRDFAGSGVVHATGGSAALAVALTIGPRTGRFDAKGDLNNIQPHSIPQAALGAFIFLFGAIAFNAGSNLTISNAKDGPVISLVCLNTLICVAAATTTSLFYQRYCTASGRSLKNWNFINMLNGSFTGMVVICAGCDQYPPWAAFVVGCLGYFAFLLVLKAMHRFQIDDATNGVPVQLGGGYFGVIGAAIFGHNGIILNPSKSSVYGLLVNIFGGLVIIVFSFFSIFLLYAVLRYFHLHRVTAQEETLGLDLAIHNQAAYDVDGHQVRRIVPVEPKSK
ncbi:putative ammonium transporter 1 [Daphnia carinata]|uniref:putative ammonium transporter 1 n=1 Tax=Daphnia carinata TaxID=120202 RepID=UPI00286952C4|nr:putative ammonium transporter 1 [Daphnia carinata]